MSSSPASGRSLVLLLDCCSLKLSLFHISNSGEPAVVFVPRVNYHRIMALIHNEGGSPDFRCYVMTLSVVKII
jgi:hypothetical protein